MNTALLLPFAYTFCIQTETRILKSLHTAYPKRFARLRYSLFRNVALFRTEGHAPITRLSTAIDYDIMFTHYSR